MFLQAEIFRYWRSYAAWIFVRKGSYAIVVAFRT